MSVQDLVIETKNLEFSFYSGKPIVNKLSLLVPKHSIFGFLGPNGAGKTTTINLLTGMLPNAADNVFLFGKSIKSSTPEVFHKIGSLIETPSLYLHLNAIENLRIINALRGTNNNNISEVLELVGLTHAKKRKVKEYSLGMKQRLGIALALLPNPELLILDEPVNGLDPTGMIEIRELLKKLNKENGITVFISSHLLSEVEKMCTHVAIIHKGELQFQGTMNELLEGEKGEKQAKFIIKNINDYFQNILTQFPHSSKDKNNDLLMPYNTEQELAEINKSLSNNGVPIIGIHAEKSLEDWFIQLTSN